MPNKEEAAPFVCPFCSHSFTLLSSSTPHFCPLCGHSLSPKSPTQNSHDPSPPLLSQRYQLLESIGKGGMGEVFSAFDTLCGRRIALKQIRSDLLEHPQIRYRFLREAHITCQLTHPAIIPIYSIQTLPSSIYYTMPLIKGETLKQIIRKTGQQEKKGETLDPLGGSIPALMRLFMTICQGIAYAHTKGVLHRDLKLENIIIGQYGEVLILDWGLAKYIDHSPLEEEFSLPDLNQPPHATKGGKIVGTLAYMAPERAKGQPATIQTEIYALGVILYQLLTLVSPFKRRSLKEFRQRIERETWQDPVLAAPHRDVPKILARITEKCLHKDPGRRYFSVDEIIHELKNYLEGRSDWFYIGELSIKRKEDWEFQEHVLIAQHVAITRITEETEWVHLMISRQSFTDTIRIETSVCLGEKGEGIGLLFSVPEASERTSLNEGYCLWLSGEGHRSSTLLRSSIEVMPIPDIFLKRHQKTKIRIEKREKSIHLYLDDLLQFSYVTHLPLMGTHVGLLSKEGDFTIDPLKISVGSLNLMVNCLAIPDAFLAHRDFPQALSEYRRIAYSFPDRSEGREALFRSGLTFLEQAKGSNDKMPFLESALEEFEKLHGTAGGPLEYLGKALVYQMLEDSEEEIKCFEIACRRYFRHPLLPLLQEHILSRMHEVARTQRMAAYRFILLTSRHFAAQGIDAHTRRLFSRLQRHWEPLAFIEERETPLPSLFRLRFATLLAFWLAKPYLLGEILDDLIKEEPPSSIEIANLLTCLIELGASDYAQHQWERVRPFLDERHREDLQKMVLCHQKPLDEAFSSLLLDSTHRLEFSRIRTLLYLMDRALSLRRSDLVQQMREPLKSFDLSFDERLAFNQRLLWADLLEKNWKRARELLYTYPVELLNTNSTLLHFLFGCWLLATEGKEMAKIHFMGLLHVKYPRSWTLAGHELIGDLSLQRAWLNQAFLWEKRQLYHQLALYYHCAGEKEQSESFYHLYQQQFIHIEA